MFVPTDLYSYLVYRPALVRRLTRLEKLLKLSPEMRHVSQGTSLKPEEVYVEGIRIRRRANSSVVDQMGLDEANNPIRGTVEIGNRAWGALSDMKGDNSVGGVPPGATTKWKVSVCFLFGSCRCTSVVSLR